MYLGTTQRRKKSYMGLDDFMCFMCFIGHKVRSKHQRTVLKQLLNSLQPHEVFLIVDWKMKILPFMFREQMKEFFGKAGLSLHGCAVLYRPTPLSDHNILFFDDLCSDSKQESSSGFIVENFVHTEAQDGKTCLDGHFAFIMQTVRLWAQEGNDVLLVDDIYKALMSHRIKGSIPALITLPRTQPTRNGKWPDITRISHYQFTKDGVIWWESSEIGSGILKTKSWVESRCVVDVASLRAGVTFTCDLVNLNHLIIKNDEHKMQDAMKKADKISKRTATRLANHEEELEQRRTKQKETALWYCENEGCHQRFVKLCEN
eukprot:Pompholyxophrys_punicea_v1_NODE_822_length_1245_cov_12.218304.p1 type:complete len:317 gc:universal NODE_822_length_1245_cov_12.218304:1004-54(-)